MLTFLTRERVCMTLFNEPLNNNVGTVKKGIFSSRQTNLSFHFSKIGCFDHKCDTPISAVLAMKFTETLVIDDTAHGLWDIRLGARVWLLDIVHSIKYQKDSFTSLVYCSAWAENKH